MMINPHSYLKCDTALVILCGGLSQRLGTDKGLYAPLGDEPLVARALRLLAKDFGELLVVVRDEEQRDLYAGALKHHLTFDERSRLRIVADTMRPGAHANAALIGVATALHFVNASRLLVLPVDQIGVRSLHLDKLFLASALHEDHVGYFDTQRDEFLAFPSLWRKAGLTRLEERIAAGALSVKGALYDKNAHRLAVEGFADELSLNGNTKDELHAYFGAPLFDQFERRLHYLRFSLTEACNLSCTYCLPEGFPEWYRHKARLGMDQVNTLLRGFRHLGFRKIRFTGGEPTVHPHCLDAVDLARRLGYEAIALTTNGLLIKDLPRWINHGLTHLNVSLDALDEERFFAVTKSRQFAIVRQLVEDAAQAGIDVKVNTVLLRSKNGDAENIERLIDWAVNLPITLRFIELMETKLNGSFAGEERVLGTEVEPLLRSRGLLPIDVSGQRPDLRGPSTDYAAAGLPGRIGLINPMSCNFCSKCNRLRVTSQGRLKLCLFGDSDIPLDLTSSAAVALNVRRLIDRKPERHYLEDGNVGNVATFRTIGG